MEKDDETRLAHEEIRETLDICAALVYAADADWRHTVYWFAAAILTASVTF